MYTESSDIHCGPMCILHRIRHGKRHEYMYIVRINRQLLWRYSFQPTVWTNLTLRLIAKVIAERKAIAHERTRACCRKRDKFSTIREIIVSSRMIKILSAMRENEYYNFSLDEWYFFKQIAQNIPKLMYTFKMNIFCILYII